MSSDDTTTKTPAEKLAEAVARKAAKGGGREGVPGQRSAERAAAAHSASKSRPAPRKG